jgi:hypothetical protein
MCCRDYDEAKGSWVWAREAPPSQKAPGGGDTVKKLRKKVRVLQPMICRGQPAQFGLPFDCASISLRMAFMC